MKNRDRALFIVVEGIDGAGKSTLCHRIGRELQNKGRDVLLTFEPSDGFWGQKLRESFKAGRNDPEEELTLFLKDREEHVSKVIAPALAQGKTVICDRYYLSTIAYQGARGLSTDYILAANQEIAPAPDLAFLLHLPVDEAIKRIRVGRGDAPNLFERQEYLERVADLFDKLNFPWLVKLNALVSEDELLHKVLGYIDDYYNNRSS